MKKTPAQKLWAVTRKKIKKQKEELTKNRKYEVINGKKFEYPCYEKGHYHTLDCCTPEMWDECSVIAYKK